MPGSLGSTEGRFRNSIINEGKIFMSTLQEMAPGLVRWSEFNEERQLNFNGYYLSAKGESVLIDPPAPDDDGLKELKDRVKKNTHAPLKAILLTNVHHDRASLSMKDLFNVPIYIHEGDEQGLEFDPDYTFKDGDTLPCGLKVIHLKNQKSPGESAFYLAGQKKLFVGDALISKTPGQLTQLPPDKFKDIAKAKESLKVLMDYDFEDLLLGDGEPIQGGAKRKLQEFLGA